VDVQVVVIIFSWFCGACLCHETQLHDLWTKLPSRAQSQQSIALDGDGDEQQPLERNRHADDRVESLQILAMLVFALNSAVTLTPRTSVRPKQSLRSSIHRRSRRKHIRAQVTKEDNLNSDTKAEIARKQIEDFKVLWESGRCDEEAKNELKEILARGPLCGRLIHARPSQFEYLNSCEWKKFSFVFGAESLEAFLGKDARGVAAVLEIPPMTIEKQLNYGHAYKLVLFAGGADFDCVRADWEGLEHMIRGYYPEVAGKVIAKIPEIRNLTFNEINDMADYDMKQAASSRVFYGRDLGDFNGTVVGVRQWLWDHVGLGRDYTGTGYTRGRSGTPEYFAVNRPLRELPGYDFIDLDMR